MRRDHLRWGIVLIIAAGAFMAAPARAQQKGFELFPNAPQLSLFPDLARGDGPLPSEQVFVHPITDPYFHEDSFVATDVRPVYAYQTFSDNSILGGGVAQVAAAEVRIAITDQIQFVAPKDGFTWLHPGLFHADGWNDIAAGLKWEFLQDHRDQLYSAIGAGYQFPWGESKSLANKEQVWLWGSVDKGFDRLHVGATFNYFIATGEEGLYGAGNHLSGHLHLDYWVCDYFSPVAEANYYHTTQSHDAALPIQGADLTDLGGGANDDICTLGIGAEVRPIHNLALRAAWEKNVTHPDDIFDSRVTVSAVITF
jgi:hypothetical protein